MGEEKESETEARLRDTLIEKERASRTAAQLQDDIMVITHQLQAPLSSVMAALSSIKPESVPPAVRQRISFARDLIEDSLYLCYGIFVSFAHSAGRRASFHADVINVPDELQRLCERLLKTASRRDLSVRFYREAEFPVIRMDRNVFTSVFYSLIHNALKYADEKSEVRIGCEFDRATGEARVWVKSVGPPIPLSERELIFEKFQRGREVSRTGRYHAGAGLGLWVARELMRAVRGDVTLELSAAHPQLSAFVVRIPQAGE